MTNSNGLIVRSEKINALPRLVVSQSACAPAGVYTNACVSVCVRVCMSVGGCVCVCVCVCCLVVVQSEFAAEGV